MAKNAIKNHSDKTANQLAARKVCNIMSVRFNVPRKYNEAQPKQRKKNGQPFGEQS